MKKTTRTLSFFLFLVSAFLLHLSSALNVGLHSSVSVGTGCSNRCESSYCSLPPLLRYGKYCGILYSGCPGEEPCDGLDECCMVHDACIQSKNHDYLNVECNENFLKCIKSFREAGKPTFKGNTCPVGEVVEVMSLVMDAAIIAGRIGHKH